MELFALYQKWKTTEKERNSFRPAYLKMYADFYIKIKVADFILKIVDKTA